VLRIDLGLREDWIFSASCFKVTLVGVLLDVVHELVVCAGKRQQTSLQLKFGSIVEHLHIQIFICRVLQQQELDVSCVWDSKPLKVWNQLSKPVGDV
jgi:hypothetical protein